MNSLWSRQLSLVHSFTHTLASHSLTLSTWATTPVLNSEFGHLEREKLRLTRCFFGVSMHNLALPTWDVCACFNFYFAGTERQRKSCWWVNAWPRQRNDTTTIRCVGPIIRRDHVRSAPKTQSEQFDTGTEQGMAISYRLESLCCWNVQYKYCSLWSQFACVGRIRRQRTVGRLYDKTGIKFITSGRFKNYSFLDFALG